MSADVSASGLRILSFSLRRPFSSPHLVWSPSEEMSRLFGLALALSRSFSLLLLDEPERPLDTERVEELIQKVESLANEGATVIAATHRAEIIDRACVVDCLPTALRALAGGCVVVVTLWV
ncbi:AAA family ATPase [Nesterenkonia salmonea]|uniref:AAA family ATPase n=1 Tax=Nesterenkonia salmonea TaxID=1804987 RepID=UPI00140D7F12|nr:AAA family ATPase [Nesterenkonia salmonea]